MKEVNIETQFFEVFEIRTLEFGLGVESVVRWFIRQFAGANVGSFLIQNFETDVALFSINPQLRNTQPARYLRLPNLIRAPKECFTAG